jgi:hypothetical protein
MSPVFWYNTHHKFKENSNFMAQETVGRKRGLFSPLKNALSPTEVYVARKIVLPFVPHAVVRPENRATAACSLVATGSRMLSAYRVVTAREVAERRARVLQHA